MDGRDNPQRLRMVEDQIRDRGVRDDRVLDAMLRVPRERFVDPPDFGHAFKDGPLSIGWGQTISQPYIVAYMTELLELSGKERVLEVGTGSGYQTAVLAEMCHQVYSLERIPALARQARTRLCEELAYRNIRLREGDGRNGWPNEAPFDRILATAAPGSIPEPWLNQLGDPGILVTPLGDLHQRIVRVLRHQGRDRYEELIDVAFVPCV